LRARSSTSVSRAAARSDASADTSPTQKGRFVFADLPAHDLYFLNASHFGYVNGGFGVTPFRGAPTRIRLADGEWFRDAHIRLCPPTAVSGRVLDEPAGEYFLVAVDEEEMHGWQDPLFLEQAQARATRVAIGWGDTKVQDLQVGRVR